MDLNIDSLMDISKKMEDLSLYKFLHTVDIHSNYGVEPFEEKTDENKMVLASYIHKNYDKMDVSEMRSIALKCLSEKKIKKILLEHELKYYNEKSKKMSLKEFITKTVSILDRYQCKAGGFYIEDTKWSVHDYTSEEHDVRENEVVFSNTIDKLDLEDNETQHYLKRIEKRLSNLSPDIDVEITYNFDNKSVVIVTIWATNRAVKESPKISL